MQQLLVRFWLQGSYRADDLRRRITAVLSNDDMTTS